MSDAKRAADGDSRFARPAQARSLACPNCGSPIEIRASGISISAACHSCGAVLDVANEEVRLIAEAAARTRQPPIPIGKSGTLAGTEWEVVGYQVRSSGGGSWEWEEYLLFNPYRGFRFLGQDHGDWTLYGMLRREVAEAGDHVEMGDGRRYAPGEAVTARTDYVLGEFYWRVRVGDTVEVREFAAAPFILVEERAADEVTWSRGIHLAPATVEAAFGVHGLPAASGGGPAPAVRRWPIAVAALVVLALLAMVPFGRDHDRQLLERTLTFTAPDQDRTLPAIPVEVPTGGGNLKIASSADPQGGLLRLDVAIAAPAQRFETNFSFGSLVGIGPETASTTFASVPGGRMLLLVKPHSSLLEPVAVNPLGTAFATAPTIPVALTTTIVITRHVLDPGLMVLAVIAILIWPAIALIGRWLKRLGGA